MALVSVLVSGDAAGYGGDFGTFDFSDPSQRPVILGFDREDVPDEGPAWTPLAGFFPLLTPDSLIVFGSPGDFFSASPLYDRQAFPGQPDNVSSGLCLAPGYVVRTLNGFGYCRTLHTIHNDNDEPGPPTGTTNAAFEMGAIQRYYPDTAIDDEDGDGVGSESRNAGELPDRVIAGAAGATRPYLERANRLLAGVYTHPAPPTYPGAPSGAGYAMVSVAAGDWRNFIDTTGSLITVEPIAGELAWSDLRVVFELATGHATLYATGTVDGALGRQPLYIQYSTRGSAMTTAGFVGFETFWGTTIPGDVAGVQYAFATDTPLDFFCTADDPANGVGPTHLVIDAAAQAALGRNLPCVALAPDTLDSTSAGTDPQRDNLINMVGVLALGDRLLVNGFGDIAFWEAPEPSSLALLFAALGGLLALSRRSERGER